MISPTLSCITNNKLILSTPFTLQQGQLKAEDYDSNTQGPPLSRHSSLPPWVQITHYPVTQTSLESL